MKAPVLEVKDVADTYIAQQQGIKLGPYDVYVTVSYDDTMGAPWKEHDGHGPVRESHHPFGMGRKPPKRLSGRPPPPASRPPEQGLLRGLRLREPPPPPATRPAADRMLPERTPRPSRIRAPSSA